MSLPCGGGRGRGFRYHVVATLRRSHELGDQRLDPLADLRIRMAADKRVSRAGYRANSLVRPGRGPHATHPGSPDSIISQHSLRRRVAPLTSVESAPWSAAAAFRMPLSPGLRPEQGGGDLEFRTGTGLQHLPVTATNR